MLEPDLMRPLKSRASYSDTVTAPDDNIFAIRSPIFRGFQHVMHRTKCSKSVLNDANTDVLSANTWMIVIRYARRSKLPATVPPLPAPTKKRNNDAKDARTPQ